MARGPTGREAMAGGGSARYERHRPEHTLLYQLVDGYYPALEARLAAQGKKLPEYVQREFEDYLKCGRLERGFLRVRCDTCHAERLVAFSCKKRGFCPSCGARRMAESAALLVDEVLPEAPMRQWGEERPFVQWTNAALRTAGQDVRTGTTRQGRLVQQMFKSLSVLQAVRRSWARCWASSIAPSPRI